MFSSCLRTTQGSGLKKDKSKGQGGARRHRVHSCLHGLWPFSRKGKILTKDSQGQDHTEQGENASDPQNPREPQRESRLSAKTVVRLVNNLVPSLQEGDPFFVPNFLSTYKRFATPLQVLDLLFMRYANFCPHSEEDEQVKKTLCSFLDTWLDKNPEDFCEPSDLFPLQYLEAYLSVYIPHSDLLVRVTRIQTRLQEIKAEDSQATDEEDSDLGGDTSSDPELKCFESVGKPTTLEPDPTCAPELESTKAPRSFWKRFRAAARRGRSSHACTPDSSCGTCVSACL